jgi:hypothetical protein
MQTERGGSHRTSEPRRRPLRDHAIRAADIQVIMVPVNQSQSNNDEYREYPVNGPAFAHAILTTEELLALLPS